MKIAGASRAPWAKGDLFFLEDALRLGMSAEQVAGFLGKPADEVQARARMFSETVDQAEENAPPLWVDLPG